MGYIADITNKENSYHSCTTLERVGVKEVSVFHAVASYTNWVFQ